MILSAVFALFVLPSCKDDDSDEGMVNVRIDNSRIVRPNKANRYQIQVDGRTLVAEIEAKSVSVPEGTHDMLVASNLAFFPFEGTTLTMPANNDGEYIETKVSDQFGYARQSVTSTNGSVTPAEFLLKPVPTLRIEFNIGKQPTRIKAIRLEVTGVVRQWNCFEDIMAGSPGTLTRTVNGDASKTTYTLEQMFLGLFPGENSRLTVTVEFNDSPDSYVYETSAEEVTGISEENGKTSYLMKPALEVPQIIGE